MDHRLAKHEISSLGTSVEVSNQGDQLPELLESENVAATQQEPTGEEHDQGNQPSKLPMPLKEPTLEEPKVPAGSQDPQVEADEVKGSEV